MPYRVPVASVASFFVNVLSLSPNQAYEVVVAAYADHRHAADNGPIPKTFTVCVLDIGSTCKNLPDSAVVLYLVTPPLAQFMRK